MSDKEVQQLEPDVCPVCGGAGEIEETYAFKPRHRYDVMGESQHHAEPCWLCGGQPFTPEMLLEWQTLQSYPVCPSCGGIGGKRWWRWGETEGEPEQVFTYMPCKLCGGKRHVSPDVKRDYESQRRTVQCGTLVVVVVAVILGLWGATALVTTAMRATPLLLCCPTPHVIFPSVIILYLLHRKGLI